MRDHLHCGESKNIVRVARRGPDDVGNQSRFEVTQALLANGYDSALRDCDLRTRRLYWSHVLSPGERRPIVLIATARARLDGSQSFICPRHLRWILVSEAVGFLPRAKSVTGDAPHWADRDMFGNVGGCECKHCRSVYSPAAYMVHLLQFLQRVCVTRASTGACVRTCCAMSC